MGFSGGFEKTAIIAPVAMGIGRALAKGMGYAARKTLSGGARLAGGTPWKPAGVMDYVALGTGAKEMSQNYKKNQNLMRGVT